jgi:hypothetical protein
VKYRVKEQWSHYNAPGDTQRNARLALLLALRWDRARCKHQTGSGRIVRTGRDAGRVEFNGHFWSAYAVELAEGGGR